jgi:type 1 glutamine amidotransferase
MTPVFRRLFVPFLGLALAAAALLSPAAQAQNLKPDMVKKIDEALPAKATATPTKKHKVLIYTHAQGFVHSSIPYGAYAVEAMGKKTGAYESAITNNPAAFDDLSGYSAIILVNTTGDWLMPSGIGGEPKNDPNKPDPNFEDKLAKWKEAKAKNDQAVKDAKEKLESRRKNILEFIAKGGGVVGFHAAGDAQYNWKEFGQIMGGYFNQHPWHEKVGIKVEEPSHPLMAAFGGKDFEITDEIYQFREPYSRSNIRVLLKLDITKTNMTRGGIQRKDGDFGVAWVREYEKGHVFYSSLGHREEIYWNPTILKFYLDGIQFALGDLKADATPSEKAKPAAHAGSTSSDSGVSTLVVRPQPVVTLFDGRNLDAWNYKKDGWKIEDNAMTLNKGGDYIWTKEKFTNFELYLEFKVSKDCNSGIFFRTDPKDPVQKGFEIQIADSYEQQPDKHNTGALYDAQAATKMTIKEADRWNTCTLTCRGSVIIVFINGEKVNELNIDEWKEANKNPDGSKNKFTTALKDLPRTGQIGFQDHGHPVWYRNITLKPL